MLLVVQLRELKHMLTPEMVPFNKNGRLSMLTKHQRNKLKDSMNNSDSISIDHSTSDQDSQ
jgi:hypothetical protein